VTYLGPIFDADTHIHEKDYSFFRQYLPPEYRERWTIDRKTGPDGRFGLHIGDLYLENSEANPEGLVPPPGRLKEWLRAMKAGESILHGWIAPTPDMDDRLARLAKLDEFGVEGAILFPGEILAALAYLDEPRAADAVLHAYNCYMAERWSFNVEDRLYPTPFLGLWDVDRAVAEAEWIVRKGARTVVMPMGPYNNRSPADPANDAVWGRLNEAGVAVTFHISDSNFLHPMLRQWGEKPFQPRRRGQSAFTWMFGFSDLAVQMTLSSFIFHNFFDRFPRIRLCSVENGAKWLPAFLEKMDVMRGMAKNGYWPCGPLKRRPSEIFKEHCFIVAYPEDNVKQIVDVIGTERCILMGSDYPHAEGVPTPRDFAGEALRGLTAEQVRNIMHDNGRRLLPKAA
jgi:predicted TIM-barrel fold metal-dependent hydrolase